jgi:hypothetical protein
MLPTNHNNDPVVEILRLAYRRGLAIREEMAEQNQTVECTDSSNRSKGVVEQSTSAESDRSGNS